MAEQQTKTLQEFMREKGLLDVPVTEHKTTEEFMDKLFGAETDPPKSTVVSDGPLGRVSIEGEVTPEKQALAKQFHDIFAETTKEVVDISLYKPSPGVLELVKSGLINEQNMEKIKELKSWEMFQLGSEWVMKTPDNRLESVKEYCGRLEKGILMHSRLREDAQRMLAEAQEKITKLENRPRTKPKKEVVPEPVVPTSMEIAAGMSKAAGLHLWKHIRIFLIALLGREKTNGKQEADASDAVVQRPGEQG